MGGFCPDGAAPPDCFWGQRWTPNDPLFFMHHAVRDLLRLSLTTLTWTMQMIDKIWYDWQEKSLRNKYAFGGGSVAALGSFAAFSQFPTGLPPFLNVSASSHLRRAHNDDLGCT